MVPTDLRTSTALTRFTALTPNDSVDAIPHTALYIGGAGNVALQNLDGSGSAVLVAVPVGTLLRVSAKRVLATGTTATNIVAAI